jgi:polyphosphate kinase 2 (PPK2 family)
VLGHIDELAFERELDGINRFEPMLADHGALILKLWFHLACGVQKKRLKKVRSLPETRRQVLEEWSGFAHHGALVRAGEKLARATSTGYAPWVVIPSGDAHYRDLTMGRTIEQAVRKRLAGDGAAPTPAAAALISVPGRRTALDALDLSRSVAKAEYERQLRTLQDRRAAISDGAAFREIGLILAFEGNDAAGKGGSTRRVTEALDPRRFDVHSIAAPSDEEKAEPYLWRFWRRLPRKGNVAIFDRTWYGRVLVERVEGYCTEAEWLRAYGEINDFEAQLHEFGFVVVKFWLAISKDEQARRFEARRDVPTSATRSPTRTGAIATNGTTMCRRSVTWSTAPAPRMPPGPWSRPRTSATPGSRRCAPSATGSRHGSPERARAMLGHAENSTPASGGLSRWPACAAISVIAAHAWSRVAPSGLPPRRRAGMLRQP